MTSHMVSQSLDMTSHALHITPENLERLAVKR